MLWWVSGIYGPVMNLVVGSMEASMKVRFTQSFQTALTSCGSVWLLIGIMSMC